MPIDLPVRSAAPSRLKVLAVPLTVLAFYLCCVGVKIIAPCTSAPEIAMIAAP